MILDNNAKQFNKETTFFIFSDNPIFWNRKIKYIFNNITFYCFNLYNIFH